MADIERDLDVVIAHEGGEKFTNYPWDPGGPTKYGIAGRFHPGVDIANLTLAGAKLIYRRDYVIPSGADKLPEPLALNLVDACVNLGVAPAKQLLVGPRLVLPEDVNQFLWGRIQRYSDITVRNAQRVRAKKYASELEAITAQRDEFAKLHGWLRRCLQVRQESAA